MSPLPFLPLLDSPYGKARRSAEHNVERNEHAVELFLRFKLCLIAQCFCFELFVEHGKACAFWCGFKKPGFIAFGIGLLYRSFCFFFCYGEQDGYFVSAVVPAGFYSVLALYVRF